MNQRQEAFFLRESLVQLIVNDLKDYVLEFDEVHFLSAALFMTTSTQNDNILGCATLFSTMG